MRILLDQNVPVGVRGIIAAADPAAEIFTAFELGWSRLSNGDLLAAAEVARFDILLTCDQNISHQHRIDGFRVRLVVLWTNRWSVLRDDPGRVLLALRS